MVELGWANKWVSIYGVCMTWHTWHTWHELQQFAGLQRSSVTLDLRGCALSCASASAMQRRVWRLPTSSMRGELPSSQVSVLSKAKLDKSLPTASFKPCAKMLGVKSQVLGPCSGQALPRTWPRPQFNVCNLVWQGCLDMPCVFEKGT